MNKFIKKDYDIAYKRENQKRIYVDVKKEIGEEFDELLKKNNQTRSDILLPVIKDYIEKNARWYSHFLNFISKSFF